MATQAVTEGRAIEAVDAQGLAALEWMHEQEMVSADGCVVAAFVSMQTCLSKPALVEPSNSRYAIMRRLIKDGWTQSGTPGPGSVEPESKTFYAGGSLEYFLLLQDYFPQLFSYDSVHGFYHSQLNGYYDCLLLAFSKNAA